MHPIFNLYWKHFGYPPKEKMLDFLSSFLSEGCFFLSSSSSFKKHHYFLFSLSISYTVILMFPFTSILVLVLTYYYVLLKVHSLLLHFLVYTNWSAISSLFLPAIPPFSVLSFLFLLPCESMLDLTEKSQLLLWWLIWRQWSNITTSLRLLKETVLFVCEVHYLI